MGIFRNSRVIKFLLGGGVAALVNLVLIALLIERLGFDTPLLRNVANAIAIELSLLFSFVIYRLWVWPGGSWSVRDLLLRQLPLYHVSAGAAVLLRVLVLFPLLDYLGVSYGVNTLLGVLLSASINYVISDRLVFSDRANRQADLYPPEGLSPAVEGSSPTHNAYPAPIPGEALTLSVLIPAYNEEGCVESTLAAITDRLDAHGMDYEILVVNDNSRDNTEIILKRLSLAHPRIRYINNYYPNGFGFAVRCGLENFQGDAVVIVMADASDPPASLVEYYEKLQEGFDCVFGSRFIKGGQVYDYPTHKLVINRLANLFVQVLFGLRYNDTTNAFKAYRREVVEGISPLISHHFNLTVEMPLKAIIRGYSSAIIPISWHNRKTGISKLKIKEMGSRYLFIVLSLFLEKMLSRGDYVQKDSFVMVHGGVQSGNMRSSSH
ncbi:MAG: glycosyltransferase [Nodosilinea sp.]